MAETSAGKYKILVVDDNVDAAEVLGMLLSAIGHEAVLANSGHAALECAMRSRPDIVLLDLALPDISGFEVAQRLRQDPQFSTLRLIALSGFGSDQHRSRCVAAGFDDYVEKPVDLDRLQALLGTR